MSKQKKSKRNKIKPIQVFGVASLIVIIIYVSTITIEVPKTYNQEISAPEIIGIHNWINSEPLKVSELKGKVVLIDFWTYSCINCIRTLPFLKDWHEKYEDDGLVIIGVHSPEFEFEKDYNNVKDAVEKFGIEYPVAMDNDFATWKNYENSYWPRKYIINQEGDIVYDHIGEGAYDETEKVITDLLNVNIKTGESIEAESPGSVGTPELYLGYRFARAPLGSPEGFQPEKTVQYTMPETPETIKQNLVYLEGLWENKEGHTALKSDGRVVLIYTAKDVNIVAGGNDTVEVKLNGNYLTEENKGDDIVIENGVSYFTTDSQTLYRLISSEVSDIGLIEIIPKNGFDLYTFTFG